ncbi:hypothetical protein BC831DRAFT_291276 [Entophlyctis helioformis]|nr:hypothetical protein BC831DRAFT_291276 [Entophlyctis helioformis]
MREIATKPLHYAATKPEFLDHLLDFPPIFSQYLRSPMRKSDKVLQYSWLLRSKISDKLGLQTPVEIARHFGNVDFVRLFSVPDASEEPVASFDKPVLTGETSAELALFRALLEDWRENEVRVLVSTFSTEIRQVLASHYRLQLETAAKAVVNKIVHGPSEPLSSTKFDVYGAFALRVTAINDKTRVLVDDAKAAAINGHGPIFNLKAVSTAAGLKHNFQRITGKQTQNSTLFVTASGDVRRTVGGLEPAVSPMHTPDAQLEAIRAYVATKKTHRTYFWLVLNRSQLVDASRMQASRFTVNGSTIIPVLREQVDRADVAQSTVAVAAANAFFMDSKHPAMAASKKPKFRWLATEVGVRVLLRLFEFRDDMIDRAISLISAPLPEFHDQYPDFKSLESLPPFQAAARWGNLSDIRAELTALTAHLADYVATGYADDTATVRFNFFVPKSFSGDAAMTAIEIAQLYRNYDVFHFLVDETTRRRDMFVPLLVSDVDFERLVATSVGIPAADKHASVERSNSKHAPAVLEDMTRSASPNPDRDDDDDDVLDHEAEAAQAARRAELRNIRRRMTDTSATFSATSATSLNEQAHGSSASLGQAPADGHEDEDEYADEHVDDAAHDDDDENNDHEEEEDE